MSAGEFLAVLVIFTTLFGTVTVYALKYAHHRKQQDEEQSRSEREMPKECGLKAQIREAVVEVLAEEKAKQSEDTVMKFGYYHRGQWSYGGLGSECKPPCSTITECHYGKEPLRYVEYDLSDVPVAQMVEELRKRKRDVGGVSYVDPGEFVDIKFTRMNDGESTSFGLTGPAEVIVIRHEKGDDE